MLPACRRRPDAVLQELDDEGVLLLTWNRPQKKNAFDDVQWDAASAALRNAQQDPLVAAVVVTGAGSDFSAGVDLSSFTQRAGPRADGPPSAYHAFMEVLVAFDKPLLAAAKGVGVGIGCTSTATWSTRASRCDCACRSCPSASCPREPAA